MTNRNLQQSDRDLSVYEPSTNGDGPAQKPADEPADPFDTDRIRQASLENIGVEKITLTIPVRRPGRNEFFRVHPDPGMTVDWFVLERDDDMDREAIG
jgi:hypothetical protein